jgi:hypothetical protein
MKATLQVLLACAGMSALSPETQASMARTEKRHYIPPPFPDSVQQKNQRLAKRKRKLKRGF